MSLPHALLTSLIERPATGYDLARRFDRSIGYFWHATHQQIYRELGRMERAGWIEVVPGEGRGKAYRCLPAGRRELRRWAAAPPPSPGPRDALLVALRADAAVGPVGLAAAVRERLAHHEDMLARYREIEARDFAVVGTRAEELQHLVLAAGLDYEQAQVRWCRRALSVLEAADGR